MNWGRAVILAFVIFAIFIITFVVKMMRTDTPGIPEKYYEKGLAYQDVIDAESGAAKFGPSVWFEQGEVGVAFGKIRPDSGTLYLEWPPDNKWNLKMPVIFENGDTQLLAIKGKHGFYNVRLEFLSEGKKYLYKTRIWVE